MQMQQMQTRLNENRICFFSESVLTHWTSATPLRSLERILLTLMEVGIKSSIRMVLVVTCLCCLM